MAPTLTRVAEPEVGELERRAPVASPRRGERLVLSGVAGCFALSGFAALLYQTAWLRQFTLVFGTSELALVSVLAAYMGGLALGSAIAGRYVGRIRRPVLVDAGVGGALLVRTHEWREGTEIRRRHRGQAGAGFGTRGRYSVP